MHSIRQISLRTIIIISAWATVSCSTESRLDPFQSDGCSLFPDRAEAFDAEWCRCCFEHDIAYWKGGTKLERQQADQALRSCVAESTGNETLAEVMYDGVRAGGSPHFPTWYRWGYGWSPNRGYQALTDEEQAMAATKLAETRDSAEAAACR